MFLTTAFLRQEVEGAWMHGASLKGSLQRMQELVCAVVSVWTSCALVAAGDMI